MPKQHFMIDLETLNTASDAVVLSIGVAHFGSLVSQREGFYKVLDKDQQLAKGRTSSVATLEWWNKQSPEARTVLTAPKEEVRQALTDLSQYLNSRAPEIKDRYVWGNAASFDLKILESLYHDFNIAVPWLYSNELCYRTLKELTGHKANMPKGMVAHNALVDAEWQAEQAEIMWDILGISYRMLGD